MFEGNQKDDYRQISQMSFAPKPCHHCFYKVADEIKRSPKGFTTTLERDGKAKYQQGEVIAEEKVEKKKPEKTKQTVAKSKKKSLDELLDIEGGMI